MGETVWRGVPVERGGTPRSTPRDVPARRELRATGGARREGGKATKSYQPHLRPVPSTPRDVPALGLPREDSIFGKEYDGTFKTMLNSSKTAQDALAEGQLHAELERLVAELASLAPTPDPPVPPVDPELSGLKLRVVGCLLPPVRRTRRAVHAKRGAENSCRLPCSGAGAAGPACSQPPGQSPMELYTT